MKRMILGACALCVLLMLSGCGDVNFAPGKAYMTTDPGVTVTGN